MERGKLLVISGPSGVGKSTAIQAMLARHPDMFFSVSVTTRPRRDGDRDGVTYWFKSPEEFAAMVDAGAFYEHAEYSGHSYGTPREPVERRLQTGLDVIMDIDVQGAFQIRERCRDAVLVFLAAPSFSVLEQRLRGRSDTPEEEIQRRLQKARWEYSQGSKYDYIVVSDVLERTTDELDSILTAEKLRAERNIKFLQLEESL